MIIVIGFADGTQEEYPVDRINQIEAGITVLDEGSFTTGIFYPFHRIDWVRIKDGEN